MRQASPERGRLVAVAMSGGVDSAVAAALLVEEGRRVVGLTMDTGPAGETAVRAAVQAAARMGLEHRIVDVRERFRDVVTRPFSAAYHHGLTPNPCVECNLKLKFGVLLTAALEMGAESLATGHYARVSEGPPGVFSLLTGVDGRKDQSYFLYGLGQPQLSRVLFPLGQWTKEEVRAIAAARGFPAVSRAESRDICFAEGESCAAAVTRVSGLEPVPGPIIDALGRRLGTHRGLVFYTVGQRRTLGLSGPRPLYVRDLIVEDNAVVVGAADELESHWLVAGAASFVSGEPPPDGRRLEVKVRYRSRPAEARFASIPVPEDRDGCRAGVKTLFRLDFDRPQRAVAPGQAAVLYDGPRVIGGGTIQTTESREKVRSTLRPALHSLPGPGDKDDA